MDINNAEFVSGLGYAHTNEPDASNPRKKLTPYLTIVWGDIQKLVDHPQTVDKTQAQWLIPSTLQTRLAKKQHNDGQYWVLWADLDKSPPPITTLSKNIDDIFNRADFEIFNTKSATLENQKCRILVPLVRALSGDDWVIAQEIFNNKLSALNIKPDESNTKFSQLCYLPNKGAIYDTASIRNKCFFDPLNTWNAEFLAAREAIRLEFDKLEAARASAKVKRGALRLSDAPTIFEAFNKAYTPQDWLITAGYDQRGNSFRHPNSESGSFSATVRDGRVHSLSTNDPLYSDGQGAHDAFSTFRILMHQGDQRAALKDAGDNLLSIDGLSWNKAEQIEFKRKDSSKKTQSGSSEKTAPFSLKKFSLKGNSAVMKQSMLGEKFVLDQIAILGQATVIYAKPNTGKTLLVLWMLIQSIKTAQINGENVFYVNADDHYKGLTYKTELAERYGFEMLAPGHNGFESDALQGYMREMIDGGTASGSVIILDTLKKFTDLMSKKESSAFMKRGREFVSAGGTLILLAHTNKNRDAEGKVVFAGTSDILDDVDCGYTLDETSKTPTTKTVLFENIKSRGAVASELSFTYTVADGVSYQYLLDSVEMADKKTVTKAKQDRDKQLKREKDQPIIDAITETIQSGITRKTELIGNAANAYGYSKPKITKVLKDYTGASYQLGHLWIESIGDKNAKTYSLLTDSDATASDYRWAKNRE